MLGIACHWHFSCMQKSIRRWNINIETNSSKNTPARWIGCEKTNFSHGKFPILELFFLWSLWCQQHISTKPQLLFQQYIAQVFFLALDLISSFLVKILYRLSVGPMFEYTISCFSSLHILRSQRSRSFLSRQLNRKLFGFVVNRHQY